MAAFAAFITQTATYIDRSIAELAVNNISAERDRVPVFLTGRSARVGVYCGHRFESDLLADIDSDCWFVQNLCIGRVRVTALTRF